MDQLFNFGAAWPPIQGGRLRRLPPSGRRRTRCAVPGTDPSTGKPYADYFGWISHTYDTPYLEWAAPRRTTSRPSSTRTPARSRRPRRHGGDRRSRPGPKTTNTADALGNPKTRKSSSPGNHSGFADLVPGNPARWTHPTSTPRANRDRVARSPPAATSTPSLTSSTAWGLDQHRPVRCVPDRPHHRQRRRPERHLELASHLSRHRTTSSTARWAGS